MIPYITLYRTGECQLALGPLPNAVLDPTFWITSLLYEVVYGNFPKHQVSLCAIDEKTNHITTGCPSSDDGSRWKVDHIHTFVLLGHFCPYHTYLSPTVSSFFVRKIVSALVQMAVCYEKSNKLHTVLVCTSSLLVCGIRDNQTTECPSLAIHG